jgi:hypothetical protein
MDEKGTHNIEDGTYKYNSVGNTHGRIFDEGSETRRPRARVCV